MNLNYINKNSVKHVYLTWCLNQQNETASKMIPLLMLILSPFQMILKQLIHHNIIAKSINALLSDFKTGCSHSKIITSNGIVYL